MEMFQISYIIVSINCVINVLCLYLQYSFANKYYERFCVGIHRCWRCMLTKEATRSMIKKYQKIMDENSNTIDEGNIQQMTPLKATNE